MKDEMPGLVLDALHRAGQVRSRERIHRMARIVVHACEAGPRDGADQVEEYLRIAVDLADREIAILTQLERVHPTKFSRQTTRTLRASAASAWDQIEWETLGFHLQEVESSGAKLQSFGLVTFVNFMSEGRGFLPEQRRYELLQKGRDFLDYVRSAELPATETTAP